MLSNWWWLIYLEFCWSLGCLVVSLNAEWPLLKLWLELDSGFQTGTAWSEFSSPGDLRWTPRSLWDPRSQGWTRTSSVVILSLGSFLSKHLMRHFALELRLSGSVNCPRLILAKSPVCSAPWKGYLQRSKIRNTLTFHFRIHKYMLFLHLILSQIYYDDAKGWYVARS